MDEISQAAQHIRTILAGIDCVRDSALGKIVGEQDDSLELDSLEVYFNRNPTGEQLDLQVGSNIFNLSLWRGAEHKLAEKLLLKGASMRDIEMLSKLCVNQTRADNS